jgi:tRNA threonylcarbamoyladenosine biosynthesis protein TsaB
MTTVLAIDTSGAACTAAIWEPRDDDPGGVVLASIRQPMARGHAESLLPAIRTLLDRTARRPDSIGLIGVIEGPGAFTGLRIGLAAAAGFSLATGAGVVGVNSFDALAHGAMPGLAFAPPPIGATRGSLAVAIESRRLEMYLRLYPIECGLDAWSLGSGGEMICAPPAGLELTDREKSPGGLIVIGDGARRFCDLHPAVSPDARRPPYAIDGGVVARLAWEARSRSSSDIPTPLYLRPPDAVAGPPGRGIEQ